MHLLALPILLWYGGAVTTAGGLPRCDPMQCGRVPNPNVLHQYEQIATCMTGPGEWVAYSCTCADLDGDGYVSLRDFAAFQIAPVFVCERDLAISQESGLGFCPWLGTIHRANVIPAQDGGVVLVGTQIAEGDPELDQCLGYDPWPPMCFIDAYFSPRTLSPDEEDELSALLTAIPEEGCQTGCTGLPGDPCCEGWYDPCVILYVRYQGQAHNTYCYGDCGNTDAYRGAIFDVAEYLAELLNQPF